MSSPLVPVSWSRTTSGRSLRCRGHRTVVYFSMREGSDFHVDLAWNRTELPAMPCGESRFMLQRMPAFRPSLSCFPPPHFGREHLIPVHSLRGWKLFVKGGDSGLRPSDRSSLLRPTGSLRRVDSHLDFIHAFAVNTILQACLTFSLVLRSTRP